MCAYLTLTKTTPRMPTRRVQWLDKTLQITKRVPSFASSTLITIPLETGQVAKTGPSHNAGLRNIIITEILLWNEFIAKNLTVEGVAIGPRVCGGKSSFLVVP